MCIFPLTKLKPKPKLNLKCVNKALSVAFFLVLLIFSLPPVFTSVCAWVFKYAHGITADGLQIVYEPSLNFGLCSYLSPFPHVYSFRPLGSPSPNVQANLHLHFPAQKLHAVLYNLIMWSTFRVPTRMLSQSHLLKIEWFNLHLICL